MPTKKGDLEYELNAIDCCALWFAMYYESRKVEMMLVPLTRKKIREIADAYLAGLKRALECPRSEPYILDVASRESSVCRAYIESESERLAGFSKESRSARLSCKHTVAVHLGALAEIWEVFPKEKAQ